MKFVMLLLYTMGMQIDWLDDDLWFVMLIMLMNKLIERDREGSVSRPLH